MRDRMFLLGVVLFLSFGLGADGVEWFEVSEIEGIWNIGETGRLYMLTPGGTFRVRDANEEITSSLELFESGDLKMDEGGNVETARGTAGEFGSNLVINRDFYDIPKKAKFEYRLETLSVDLGEGGQITYESGFTGEPDSVTTISGKGKIHVKDGVVSSRDTIEIYNGDTGDITLSSVDGGEVTANLDERGRLAGIGSGDKASFEKYGTEVLSTEGTNVYWGECSPENSYLCMNDGQMTFGASNGETSPIVEMKGENAFFKSDSGNDFVRFSGGEGETNNFVVKKDIVVVGGEGEIVNGDDAFRVDSGGDIFSSKIEGSVDSAMPMKVYSSENGITADYFVEVTESGALGVEEVGVIEQGRYVVRRLSNDGVYGISGDELVTEEVSKEVAGETISEILSFDGDFELGEEVKGYTVCVSGECRGLAESGISLGTMKKAGLYSMCDNVGAECQIGADHTQTIRDLYDAKDSGRDVSVSFTTNKGNEYEF
jgi:hypothetical protein